MKQLPVLCVLTLWGLTTQTTLAADVDFVKDVKPIFQKHCVSCHGPEAQESGFRIDFGNLLMRGGDRGTAIVPGKADKSLLYRMLIGDKDVEQMPLDLPMLSDEKIAIVKTWIDAGASVPKGDRPADDGTIRSDHWSFQPIVRQPLPRVSSPDWPRNGIDWFILNRLDQEGLKPSAEASRATLMRRLYLDLLGVLPEPQDVRAFVTDHSPGAYERLVDRLLASPQYGERWGRHWLDVARYADSNGFTIDGPRSIWPYRDWVIQAINRDLPFDQFVTDQLAGDLLPNATRDQLVATGFHRNTLINQEGGTDQEQFRVEAVVDRVNTTGAALLGLTIGCAQCHVHKYDPITQREFYQVYAMFNNCDEPTIPLPDTQQSVDQKRIQNGLAKVNKQLKEHDAARAAGQPAWEKEYAALPRAEWTPLKNTEYTSEAGAVINPLDAHTLIVGGNGNIPAQDVYTVTCAVPGKTITAVRLEVLTNPGLPMDGPGFADNGNFVLNEFELSAERNGQVEKVEFASAMTDWQQEGYSADLAFDGNIKSGWAVGGVKKGSPNVNREAIFVLKEPLSADAVSGLTFRFHHKHNVDKYIIGCFRISATDQATDKPLVPVGIQKVLDAAADKRDEAQKELLVAAYGATDQSRKPLVDRQTKLKAEESQLRAAIPTTMVLKEKQKDARKTRIHIRGNFLDKGALVQPGVPGVLPPLPAAEAPANRLDFSRWLFSPEHPLTARVTVNRFWQQFFGLGIVATENDFGTQGERPVHPELLDWLASEFMQQGWSVKTMHRLIVTSSTYRQSSHVTRELLERDPQNRLLARQSRIRLEAEGVRDVALAASGLLSQKMHGPGVYPPQPKGIALLTQVSKQWPESKGDSRFRRGLYTYFWRSRPYPMLPIFDAPDANGTCTRRTRSNTPLQALTLANDEAFMELARGLADRILRDAPSYDEARIDYAVEATLSRNATPRERGVLLQFLNEQREQFKASAEDAESAASPARPSDVDASTSAAWTAVARVLLNLDEFITRE